MTVLEARDIRKTFAGVRALNDANFSLRAGEVCGLVGANGSGKTTFARIVSGLLVPDSGELRLYERAVNLRSRLDAELYRMAMVHQNLSLVPEMTVWENIALGREQTGPFGLLQNLSAINQAERMLDAISAKIPVHERVKDIAPVEKQLVEIAKALAKDPRILILDEATASVDTETEKAIQDALARLVKGRTTFAIAHRLSTLRNADRLFVFDDGYIKEVGTHDELMERPNGIYRRLVDLQREVSKMKAVEG